jgi:hypothetical protein
MSLRFQAQPGRYERHLQRRHENPLFRTPPETIGREQLTEARRQDQAEALEFQRQFRALVQSAAELRPNEPSERVLALKESLEQAYEQAAGLGDDQGAAKRALRTLIEVIMRSIWRGAAGDPLAHHELEQEETARSLHFGLLEHRLVADLLHPASPIGPEDLAPTLLSATPEALAAALQLLDPGELTALANDARNLLTRLQREGYALPECWLRLGIIERHAGGADQGEATG